MVFSLPFTFLRNMKFGSRGCLNFLYLFQIIIQDSTELDVIIDSLLLKKSHRFWRHLKLALNVDASFKSWTLLLSLQIIISKAATGLAEWIPSLNITWKYPGSNPGDAWFFFAFFFKINREWCTWRHSKVPQVLIGLRKYLTGYASIQRVTQPVILLLFFQVNSAEHE